MKKHINIIITAVASLLIVTLAGREFIKNHKKESNDKSSTNVSENTCEDIPDTSISDGGNCRMAPAPRGSRTAEMRRFCAGEK